MKPTPLSDVAIDQHLAGDGAKLRELCRSFERALAHMADMPKYDQDDEHRLRHQATVALVEGRALINS